MTTGKTEERDLQALYDAACQAKLYSTEGRSFEEWRERVSDDGLSLARHALGVQLNKERARLEREVIEAAKAWWDHPETPRNQQDIPLFDAVDALLSFEA